LREAHPTLNVHRFRVADKDSFVNGNLSGGVITRLLSATLAVFVDWPAGSTGTTSLKLQGVGSRTLTCLLCNQSPGAQTSWVTVVHHAEGITVHGLTARRFYLFEVVQPS
jgi:hypothetical protein